MLEYMIRCQLCGKSMECTNTNCHRVLGEHIKAEHPHLNISMIHSTPEFEKPVSFSTVIGRNRQNLFKEVVDTDSICKFEKEQEISNLHSNYNFGGEKEQEILDDKIMKCSKDADDLNNHNLDKSESVSVKSGISKVKLANGFIFSIENPKTWSKHSTSRIINGLLRSDSEKNPSSQKGQLRRRQRQYKTNIEKWRPGASKITCPVCGYTKRPNILTQTDKVVYSKCAADCLLTCWPICFMPCLFVAPKLQCVHCAMCGKHLGSYDPKTGTVIPNSTPENGKINDCPFDGDMRMK